MKPSLLILLLLSLSVATQAQHRHDGHRSYVGVGWKGLFNDRNSFVIDARATVGQYFSLRPDLAINSKYTMPQMALTVDGRLTRWWWLYGGGGGCYNNDGDKKLQPYVTAGTDVNLPLHITVRFSGQVLFRPGDTDTGGMVTFNIRF